MQPMEQRSASGSKMPKFVFNVVRKPLAKYLRLRTLTKLRGWSLALFIANVIWFMINVVYVISSCVWVGLDANWAIQVKWFSFDFSRLISGFVYGAIALLGILSAIIHHPIIALGYLFGLTLSLLLAVVAQALTFFSWGFFTALTGGPLALLFFVVLCLIIASCCVFTTNSPLFCCCCCSCLQIYYMQKYKLMRRGEKKLKAQANDQNPQSEIPDVTTDLAQAAQAQPVAPVAQDMDFSPPPLSQNPYDEIAQMEQQRQLQQQQQSMYSGVNNEGDDYSTSAQAQPAAFSKNEKKMADEFYD